MFQGGECHARIGPVAMSTAADFPNRHEYVEPQHGVSSRCWPASEIRQQSDQR
jgi:hypothetical protein